MRHAFASVFVAFRCSDGQRNQPRSVFAGSVIETFHSHNLPEILLCGLFCFAHDPHHISLPVFVARISVFCVPKVFSSSLV
ncbi:hypothetical protein DMENIID0001_007440 [Sergentomyia squamirostris]